MPNRVIKDSIWKSKTLAKLSPYFQDQWPRWLLMADDWGCFDADPEIIKGLAYPKREEQVKDVKTIAQAFSIKGLLFLWNLEDREWGFFVSWDKHQFVGATTYNNVGERARHRRKTPEPPQGLLNEYLREFGAAWSGLEQTPSNPNPNPNPKEQKYIYTIGAVDKSSEQNRPSAANAVLDKIYKLYKLNIYELINKFKKAAGWPAEKNIPGEVLIKICDQYVRDHGSIKNAYPWFLRVLEAETRQWQARQNISEHEAIKAQGAVSIAELLRGVE